MYLSPFLIYPLFLSPLFLSPGGGDRPVLAEDRRVVDGRPHAGRLGQRGVDDGGRPSKSRRGPAAPQRPRRTIRRRRIPISTTNASHGGGHEWQGGLPGQRGNGELPGHAQERTGEPR